MLTMNEDLKGALQSYIKLMEEGAYFEAHEVLEEAWHPLRLNKDPLANLVKGLINGAVSFEHIRRERENYTQRACKVMASFERHKGLCVKGIIHYALFVQSCKKVEMLKEVYSEVFT